MINNLGAPFGLRQLLCKGLVKIAVLDQQAYAARAQNLNERAKRAKESWKAGRITPQQYRAHLNSLSNEASKMGIRVHQDNLAKNMALSRSGAYQSDGSRENAYSASPDLKGSYRDLYGQYQRGEISQDAYQQGVTDLGAAAEARGKDLNPETYAAAYEGKPVWDAQANQAPGVGLPPANLARAMQPSREELGRRRPAKQNLPDNSTPDLALQAQDYNGRVAREQARLRSGEITQDVYNNHIMGLTNEAETAGVPVNKPALYTNINNAGMLAGGQGQNNVPATQAPSTQAPGVGLPPANLASAMQPSREELGRRRPATQAPGVGLPPANLARAMQPSRAELGARFNRPYQTAATVPQPSLRGAQEIDMPAPATPVTIPSSFMQPSSSASAQYKPTRQPSGV